jgi:Lon protease-like protein
MVLLPLFPLNTVLFPGMPLPLHIFEERYKQMISQCLEGDHMFGVVLIKHGSEALGPLAEPYQIGCSAKIVDYQPLEEGRMQIATIGERRFRIHKLIDDMAYLVGEVEYLPFIVNSPEKTQLAADLLLPKVIQYINLLNQIEPVDLDPGDLPRDAETLSNLAPAILQMPPEEKQVLLEAQTILELIETCSTAYSRETAFLRAIIARGKDQSGIPVSQN